MRATAGWWARQWHDRAYQRRRRYLGTPDQRDQRFLSAVEFTDGLNGWAVGDCGAIVHTSDGGATWSGQDSGTFNGLLG
jgi:photosystem II stability/assembly factor-like uncharacterized protein